MFITAFVWGLGVTFGGSLGLMLFVLMNYGFKRISQTEADKTLLDYHQKANEALVERNMLTLKTISALENIAEAIEWQEGKSVG